MPELEQQAVNPPDLDKEVWLAVPAWAALTVELLGLFFSSNGRHAINLGKLWAPVTLFTVAAAYASPFLAGKVLKDAIRSRARLSWKVLAFLTFSLLVGLINFAFVAHTNWESGYR